MRQFLIYVYIVAITIGGSFYVGPLSVRVLSALIVTCLLFVDKVNGKVQFGFPRKFIYLYIAFLFAMVMAQLLNGEIITSGLLKDLLAAHYVSVLTYFVIDAYIQNQKSASIVTLTLMGVTLLDAIATYFQYINSPFGWLLGQMFFNVEDVKLDKILSVADQRSGQSLLNVSIAGGIFGDSVKNGYILASFGILSIYYGLRKPFSRSNILGVICIAIFVCASFMVQQRLAFVFLCMAILWFMTKYLSKISIVIMLFVAIYIYLSYIVDIEDDSMGRLSSLEVDNTRTYIYENAWAFIQNNFLLGGPVLFLNQYGVYPHNFFFNAFIYGGFIGGLIVIFLFFKMLWRGFQIIIHSHKSVTLNLVYTAGLIVFLLIGLTHNASLVTGDTSIWILFAMMLRTTQLNRTLTS